VRIEDYRETLRGHRVGQSPTASRARITISGSGTATVAWSLPS
jgi:hypothetical protein